MFVDFQEGPFDDFRTGSSTRSSTGSETESDYSNVNPPIYLDSIPTRLLNCIVFRSKGPCENKYEYSFFPFTFLIKKNDQMVGN